MAASPTSAPPPRSAPPPIPTSGASSPASSGKTELADERRYALQLRIGTFILVSLGVFFAIVYLLGARARYFESKYEIAAEFSEVAGLIEGATVRLAGVQIGRGARGGSAPQ